MTYKLNPFTGKLDTSDGPQGPAGVVSAAGPGSQATPSISFAADLDTGLYNYTPNGIAVSTGGTGRLFIDSAGKVGVGTGPGTDQLTIGGNLGFSFQDFLVWTQFDNSYRQGIRYIASTRELSLFSTTNDSGGAITFYTRNGTGASSTDYGTERMRITADGKLGLGTSAPDSKLVIEQNSSDTNPLDQNNPAASSGATIRNYNFGVGTYTALSLETADSTNIQSASIVAQSVSGGRSPNILFTQRTASNVNSTRMVIDSSGSVGIGTTSVISGNKLQVNTGADGDFAIYGISPGAGGLTGLIPDGTNGNALRWGGVGGSAGVLRFMSGASQERARITSDGKLGLGNSSPSSLLDLKQDIAEATTLNAAGSHVRIGSGSGTGTNFRSTIYFAPFNSSGNASPAAISAIASGNTNSSLGFYTNPANDYSGVPDLRMLIDSSGRVGIGNTSPNSVLDVNGLISVRASNGVLRGQIGEVAGNTSYFGLRNTALADTFANSAINQSGTGSTSINSASGEALFLKIGNSPAVTVDSSQRLLVNTSVSRIVSGSGAKLQIESNDASGRISLVQNRNEAGASAVFSIGKSRGTTNGSNTILQNGDTVGSIAFVGADGTDMECQTAFIQSFVDGTPGSNDMPGRLVFSTTAGGASSPTERMRISQDGAIYIGADAAAAAASLSSGAGIKQLATSVTSSVRYDSYASSTGIRYHLSFRDTSGVVGTISTSGGATAYNTSSDYRLKENVVLLTGAADRLKLIPVHRFNFIADPSKTVDGFLAHEAQAVVPECVTGTKDEVDDEGNPVYQGIDQSKLVPLLTAALQEALAKIETLEQRLSDAGIA